MGTLSCTCKQGLGSLTQSGLGEKWVRPLGIPLQLPDKEQMSPQFTVCLRPGGACSALNAPTAKAGEAVLAAQACAIAPDATLRGVGWDSREGLVAAEP